MFHNITGKNIIKDTKIARYGSIFAIQNLCFLEKRRNKIAEIGKNTALYLESIAKPVQMPNKYQNLPLDVSITLIKVSNDKSQNSAKGESGTATAAPRKENTGKTFNSKTLTKAVFSLYSFFAHIYKIQLDKKKIKTAGNLTANSMFGKIKLDALIKYAISGG
jgi:hypothetical protein